MSGSRLAALLLASVSWTVQAADDLESLDEDFLSYLAEFEGDEDDWTIVDQAPAKVPAAAKPAEPSDSSAGKTTKPGAKPTPPVETATPDDGSKR
jgi:hypothetical protein